VARRWRFPGISLQRTTTATPVLHATVGQLIRQARRAFAQHNYAGALDCLEATAEASRDFADVHHLRGVCHAMLGRPYEALAAFDRAVQLNGAYAEAHVSRAITLNDLGRCDEAQEAFRSAAAVVATEGSGLYPAPLGARLANLHHDLGDAYVQGGLLLEAAEQYRRACEICPTFVDIRNKLGRTLLDLGIHAAAAREFRAALDINPGFVTARANLGLALLRCDDVDGARAEWERCLSDEPGEPQAAAYLGLLARMEAEEEAVSQVA
jgi:tetratricopeptide (TPR) repeat protein